MTRFHLMIREICSMFMPRSLDRPLRPLLPLAALAAVALSACAPGEGAPEADAAEQPSSFVRIINVEVRTLEASPFREQIRLTGAVQANRDVMLSAEESGRITRLVVDKGSEVSTGQVLLRIDGTVLRSQVDEARAQSQLAAETWQRRKRLWEDDQVGSELAYLEARFAAEQSAARLQALEQRLARTEIRSPIDGVFDQRMVEVGTLVSPGTPVARVVQVDPVKVVAGVPERYGTEVTAGMSAQVFFDVLDGQAFAGEISYVGATVDPSTRTFAIEVEIANPGGRIKPEMIANVALLRREFEDVIVVPQEALVRTADGFRAFVVEGQGDQTTARAVDVVLGANAGNEIVVEQGLEPGQRLVIVGQQQLAGGDQVRVVEGVEP